MLHFYEAGTRGLMRRKCWWRKILHKSEIVKIGQWNSGFRCQPRRRPKKRPVKSKKKLMNIEHRTSNIERRMNEFCLFFLLKRAERSDIHNSSIVNHHSSFHEVSYKVSVVKKRVPA